MVTTLGPVTIKTAQGALTVRRTGRYTALCLDDGCQWQGPERERMWEVDEDLHRHQDECHAI